jgi:hypothetical protein
MSKHQTFTVAGPGKAYRVEHSGYSSIRFDDLRPRLQGLAVFLKSFYLEPGMEVAVYTYENGDIGGVRVAEISVMQRRPKSVGGWSIMRGDYDSAGAILAAEIFLETFGEQPFRPQNWESCINDHGASRIRLMKALELSQELQDAEYERQLAEELQLCGPPDKEKPVDG